MAITARSTPEGGASGAGRGTPPAERRLARHALATAAAAVVGGLGAMPSPAMAQKWNLETGLRSQLTFSSNPELGVAGGGRDDLLLEVRPHIAIRAEGARLRLSGTAALNGVTTARDTQPSRLLPEADLNARLEAIERFFFLDAGVRAIQTSENPFGPRPESGTTRNTLTTGVVRFSPSIESAISAETRYRLRSDNSWTRQSGSTQAASSEAEGYFGRHSFLFEHDPHPFGWRLEAERNETRYRDGVQEPLRQDLARASIDYAFGPDLTAGVRVGRERTSLVAVDNERNIYGVQARWQPSPRTTLSAFEEKRFFGNSWRLSFDHRMPQVAWNVLVSRTLDTTPQALFDLPVTSNVAALLDAAFTTRFPDPVERARIVQDLITRQGLPAGTLRPVNVYAQRLSIVTQRTASVVLIGMRNTLSLGAFQTRTEDAPEGGSLATGTPLGNNNQHGASVSLSHRLSPIASLNASAEWSKVRALQGIDRSVQRTARLQLTVQAAPKTSVFGGARYRELDSNVATEGREAAVFAGLDHLF
ncbi:TIGR03016 family PEP-CTERM system-associated outer membrane protein [Piscinibacter sp. XHJ-5]|uniref:TIGR03016 family PEP-CTERM system-associated outer membrane protein n=1 Tax=Piscinibacter sp. XHJ-5 TaxID=3037797 RepID=UPI0024528B37|nr:TIGR03016 family PEP-CTERM system-associated outer membrane protein [Piscinibacter sp. XHJ-5]